MIGIIKASLVEVAIAIVSCGLAHFLISKPDGKGHLLLSLFLTPSSHFSRLILPVVKELRYEPSPAIVITAFLKSG